MTTEVYVQKLKVQHNGLSSIRR